MTDYLQLIWSFKQHNLQIFVECSDYSFHIYELVVMKLNGIFLHMEQLLTDS